MPIKLITLFTVLFFAASSTSAQVDEEQLGAWYMYFFNGAFEDSQWGVQGDVQYRNWDTIGDLEQLLVRGGITWTPKSNDALLTFGAANITTGGFGDGDDTTVNENRVYQEALLPQKIGERVYLRHRFRYEQRWVDDQDFRTRFRYALFMNIPLNGTSITPGTWYFSAYNEIFVNGERDIGDGREVDVFDRNRFYLALGHKLRDNLSIQGGYMYQYSENVEKGQLQLSLHHNF